MAIFNSYFWHNQRVYKSQCLLDKFLIPHRNAKVSRAFADFCSRSLQAGLVPAQVCRAAAQWCGKPIVPLRKLPTFITHRIHGAGIYANMDPINIPQMLAYIPAPWILWVMGCPHLCKRYRRVNLVSNHSPKFFSKNQELHTPNLLRLGWSYQESGYVRIVPRFPGDKHHT
jgi:hypothetical protein